MQSASTQDRRRVLRDSASGFFRNGVRLVPVVLRPPRDATIPALTAPPRDDAAGFLTIAAQEKRVIAEALQRTHGHKARAAALLGLTRFQLYSRLKRYHIEVAGWLGAEQV